MPNAHDHPYDARPPAQHSFLVRFWRTTPKGPWHVTLQRATNEPALHFSGVDLLFAFLLTQLGEEAPLHHHTESGDGIDALTDNPPDAT